MNRTDLTGNLWHLVRRTDPSTSFEAAARAEGEGLKRAMHVLSIMSDGIARIDEEIHLCSQLANSHYTADSIRHGRKTAMDAGLLELTGVKRKTSKDRNSRECIITESGRKYLYESRHETDGR